MKAIEAFMHQIVDYAGLFPPAKLDLKTALTRFHRYQTHRYADFLGRFVMPLGRLSEAAEVYGDTLAALQQPWRWSGLLRTTSMKPAKAVSGLENAARAVRSFEAEFPRIQTDGIEMDLPAAIWDSHDWAALRELLEVSRTCFLQDGPQRRVFVELDWRREFEPAMTAVAGMGANFGVKLRTGGVTAGMVPPAERLASFLAAAARLRVAFKATAGLHVPVPHDDPSVGARAHGFLNVFVAGMLAFRGGANRGLLTGILENFGYEDFDFKDNALRARDVVISTAEVQELRNRWMLSFGSCSFLEPLEHLERHGYLRQDG